MTKQPEQPMWHPFDIMKAHLAVSPELRGLSDIAQHRTNYMEYVTRWFGDKSSTGQWPPTVDDQPGITVERRGSGEQRAIDFRHDWRLGLAHNLVGTIEYAGPMREPTSWEIRHELDPYRGKADLLPLAETGKWSDAVVHRSITTSRGKQRLEEKAPQLLCIYTLLGDFPAEPIVDQPTAVLIDGMTLSPNAQLKKITGPLAEHPVAEGLIGYSLQHEAGLPIEFWVNENNVVIYLCEGPNRLLVLSDVEALP